MQCNAYAYALNAMFSQDFFCVTHNKHGEGRKKIKKKNKEWMNEWMSQQDFVEFTL